MAKIKISNTIRRCRFDADEMTTRQTIIAMEKSKYSPSLELAFKVARVFGKPLEEVFSDAPDEKK